jgi:hypothetical protein
VKSVKCEVREVREVRQRVITAMWFEIARQGAAFEAGRRMWRWFAAAAIAGWVVRRVLPTAVLLAALAVSVWLALRWSAAWLPRLAMLAAVSAALGALLWSRRQWWRVRVGSGAPVVAALAGATVLSALLWWMT